MRPIHLAANQSRDRFDRNTRGPFRPHADVYSQGESGVIALKRRAVRGGPSLGQGLCQRRASGRVCPS
jgi:hypothetical protein